jgi:hypothetical protein
MQITLQIEVSDELAKAIAWNINDGEPLSQREIAESFQDELNKVNDDLLTSYRQHTRRNR